MADENNGGQNPGSNEQPGAGGGNNNGGQQNPSGGGQQPVAGAGGGQAEKVFTYKEDRSDYVPRTRLNEVNGKFTEAEKRAIRAEEALAAEQKRTRALAGLETIDPKKQEEGELRGILEGMFPELVALKGLTKAQLEEVMQAATTARGASQATWERHALTMLGDLDSEAATALDVDKLTDTQQKSLRRAYREAAGEAMQEREAQMRRGDRRTLDTIATDRDFVSRHEAGDKSLIKEFVKQFVGDWYEPARRSVTARQASRSMRPVPRGERTRQIPTQGEAKFDYNNETDFKKALLTARGGGARE